MLGVSHVHSVLFPTKRHWGSDPPMLLLLHRAMYIIGGLASDFKPVHCLMHCICNMPDGRHGTAPLYQRSTTYCPRKDQGTLAASPQVVLTSVASNRAALRFKTLSLIIAIWFHWMWWCLLPFQLSFFSWLCSTLTFTQLFSYCERRGHDIGMFVMVWDGSWCLCFRGTGLCESVYHNAQG